MAKMIPAHIVNDKTSLAERKIFNRLKDDPDTKGWRVLHSMELSRRGERKPYGEIDFVVIIPGEGIVCLEVKGGGISRENGEWRTTDRHGKKFVLKKSPFAQVKDSMYALRHSIIEHFGEGSRESECPIGRMVVFPDMKCPPPDPEFERSDVIDSNDLRDRKISSCIRKTVRKRLREFQRHKEKPVPIPAEAKRISDFLRPDFDRVLLKSLWFEQVEQEMLRLTEEQYERIDELEENPRCLFEGAAGTGKTLLALEFSRRASQNGEEVLLVCYNQLLSQSLQERTKDTEIMVGTFHGVVENLIMNSSNKEEFLEKKHKSQDQQILFNEVYPFYGQLALEQLGPQFDLLVMDEAQDLLYKEERLEFLNDAIYEGLSGGRWAIFGDFSRQTIYDYDKKENPVDILKKSCGGQYFVRSKLTVNCRNTKHIAEETYLLSGFENPPSRLGEEQGPPVEYKYWKSSEDFANLLDREIKRLLQEGISVEEIVILSPRRLESSVLAGVKEISGFPLEDISRNLDIMRKKKIVKFSTIHSFKGLESPVVIVVVGGIEEVDRNNSQSLLYVSMSRAKSLLILMINEKARNLIVGLKKTTANSI